MMDVKNRTETPKMVLSKLKRPPPPVPSGPPATPPRVRARMAGLEHTRGSSLQKSAGAHNNVAKSRITPGKGFTGDWFFIGQQDAGRTARNHQVHLSVYGVPTAILARSIGFG